MKKLKQMSGPYSIGFELSSTAHGFVATDPNGNVLYHGKQPVMGTRVFKEGQHAAEARMLPYETQVASYIERTGNSVLYKVTPDFRDNELMARGVRIQAQSVDSQDDELSFDVYCYNVQPGYALDYLTGAASKG